jgi:TonB-linked SusC/RagA family outer membrane protein
MFMKNYMKFIYVSLFLFLAGVGQIYAQQARLKGVVVDMRKEPVIGANVLIKGTTTGTITDVDGNFTIEVKRGDVLQASFIGFTTKDVPVNDFSFMTITLEEDRLSLDEIVVVGYGTQKKVNLTGSITNINTDYLSNISTTNLSNTLAGRAPGVNIVGNSGIVGGSSEIRVRGGYDEPLYVIDGIVRDKAAFDALEANEVDQISFLKDAATSSVYGSQAGNGVVLVTTKTGVISSKPVFSYQGSYTFMSPTKKLLTDAITATDELIYQNDVIINRNRNNGTTLATPNGEEEFAYFKDRTYNVNDWIWQTPWNTKHSLSINGGTDKVQYFTILSYIGEEGSYVTLDNKKFNVRSNLTAKITDFIKAGLNLSANQSNSNKFLWPFANLLSVESQTVADLYRCSFNWPRTYPFYLEADGTPADRVTEYPLEVPVGSWNMWNVIDQIVGDRYNKTRDRKFNGILTLDISLDKLIKGLSTKFVGSYLATDNMNKKYLTFQNNYTFISKDPSGNRFIPAAPDPTKMSVFSFNNTQEFLDYTTQTYWENQLNWFLNYANTFGKHDINASLIFEQWQRGGEQINARGENPITHYDQMFVYSNDRDYRWGDAIERNGGRLSWIGRASYNYAQKYIGEVSFRYDGNYLFPENKRWGFFPSISAGWRISEEAFMKSVDWLNNLKVRASYGTTGNEIYINNARMREIYGTIRNDFKINEKISPFTYLPNYVTGDSYIFGTGKYVGLTQGATPNPGVTWATSTTYNGGIDATVLDNRLSGSIDGFIRVESNILTTRIVTLPDNYGQSLAPENYAQRSWRGIEFEGAWKDKASKDVSYSVYGNIGYTLDRWDKIDQEATYLPGGPLEDMSLVGGPLNVITGFKTLGMIRTQEKLDELLASGVTYWGRQPYLGGLYFEDIRGDGYSQGADGKVDGNDIQVLSKNAYPKINFGFGGSITWKDFVVDLHFNGVGKYDRMVGTSGGGDGTHSGGFAQYGGTVRPYFPIWATGNSWTIDNPNAPYPAVVGSSWYESGTGNQSFWIRNGAYVRLKNLNVGYNLPKAVTHLLGLSSAQLFFNGTNLFAISPLTEFHDPEQDTYDSYPLMRSFTFGLDIKF